MENFKNAFLIGKKDFGVEELDLDTFLTEEGVEKSKLIEYLTRLKEVKENSTVAFSSSKSESEAKVPKTEEFLKTEVSKHTISKTITEEENQNFFFFFSFHGSFEQK